LPAGAQNHTSAGPAHAWQNGGVILKDITAWYNAGLLKSRETVFDGIDHAVDAFLGVMRGENIGKMMVRLSD
jgi:NADPH-dependent curcumin reductase CurA